MTESDTIRVRPRGAVATVTLRIPRHGPLSDEKAWVLEHFGPPTRSEPEGDENMLLHWDYRP